MTTATLEHLISSWLQPGGTKQLQRLLHRIPALRRGALLALHLGGCLLMLAAPIVFIGAAGGTFYLYRQIHGPLDWFLVEVGGALAVFSGYLSLQLSLLRPAAPGGVAVRAAHAPALFASLAHRVAHFKLRSVNRVVLTTQTELRIVATPRLALPWPHRRTLCVGVPLSFFLSRGQFSLVLAAAAAAAAQHQSTLSGRLIQASDDWALILAALQTKRHLLARLLTAPVQWIATSADRLCAPLRTDWRLQQGRWLRQHHAECHTTEYLANQIVAAAFMDKHYWPMVLKGAERCPSPVVKAFSHLPILLEKTLNPALAERWLVQAQGAGHRAEAGIRDLLAELRVDHLNWSGLPSADAFGALFKSAGVLKQLDSWWQHDIEPQWRQRHNHFQQDLTRFQQLHKRLGEAALRDESALRYIKLAARFLRPADTLTACREVYAGNRDDARVCFAAGLALIRTGAPEEGIHALQRAADLEPSLSNRAHALIDEQRQAWAETRPVQLAVSGAH